MIEEFKILLNYTRNLQFEEEPDYKYIRSLLEEVFNRYSFEYDFNFDWSLRNKNKRILFPTSHPLEKPLETR